MVSCLIEIHVVLVPSPDHAPGDAFSHLFWAGARRRADHLIGAIPLTMQRVWVDLPSLAARRARRPAAHGADGMMPSATMRNSAPCGQLVGNWMRMRAACSMMRAPILIRRSRMVANSAFASGSVCAM